MRFSPVFRKGQILTADLSTSPNELRQFREYAISVDEEFALWPAGQLEEWKPKTVAFVDETTTFGLLQGTISSPSRVDTYFDRE